jgi:hypothetical protein
MCRLAGDLVDADEIRRREDEDLAHHGPEACSFHEANQATARRPLDDLVEALAHQLLKRLSRSPWRR